MARIQLLHLPTGEGDTLARFAVVVDQHDGDHAGLHQFAADIGAAGVYVTAGTLDVHQPPAADPIGVLDLVDGGPPLPDLLRQAIGGQATPKPDVSTPEGRAQMVWGAGKQGGGR